MGSLKTTSDIKKAVLSRCGELTDGSSDYDQAAVDYINTNYHSILAGGTEFDVDLNESWVWAQTAAPMLLQLFPAHTVTVSVTTGSTAATFTPAPTYSALGHYLRIATGQSFAMYKIAAHTAGSTAITLDQAFIDVTGGYTATLVKLDYLLPAPVLRMINPIIHYANSLGSSRDTGKIFEIDAGTMINDYPLVRMTCGIPDRFAVIAQDALGNLTVRFNAWPLQAIRLEVPYIPIQADLTDSMLSTPLIPFGFRDVLLHMAAYMLMVDKSDDRQQTEASLAQSKLMALKNATRKPLKSANPNFGRLVPRIKGLRKNGWWW